MSKPTEAQLKAYIKKLPEIYRYVLESFAKAVPERRRGESIHTSIIAQWVTLQDDYYHSYDVHEAVDKLIEKKILNLESEDAYNEIVPTELGERIILILTGIEPTQNVVPDLPEFSWS